MLNIISSCTLVHTFELSSIPGSTAEGIGVKIYEDDHYYQNQSNHCISIINTSLLSFFNCCPNLIVKTTKAPDKKVTIISAEVKTTLTLYNVGLINDSTNGINKTYSSIAATEQV